VIVVRKPDGSINALVNKCVHKGSNPLLRVKGKSFPRAQLHLPLSQLDLRLRRHLTSVAFEKGIQGKGACPDFDKSRHRLIRLRVETIAAHLRHLLGEDAPAARVPRPGNGAAHGGTLYGTPKILGRYSQLLPNTNWKLYVENSRDNYHRACCMPSSPPSS